MTARPRLQQLHQSGATDGQVPVWDNTAGIWVPDTPASGAGTYCRAVLTAAGGEDEINLGVTPTTASEQIFVNGTRLIWGTDYTLTAGTATLTTPLTAADDVVVLYSASSCGTASLTTSGGSAYAAAVLSDSPAAYWRCGEASGNLVDSSGNSRTLTATGTPTYGVTGLISGDPDDAINYDTDGDYHSRADTVISRYTSAWTLEAVVKPSGNFSEAAIVATDYDGSRVTWALRTVATRKVQAAFYNGSWRTAQSTIDLTVGTIYHLAATWDGTDLKIYIDGVLDATSTPGSAVSSPTSATVYLGRRWDNNTHFPGDIDEVAIYPTDIGATRIAAHAALV